MARALAGTVAPDRLTVVVNVGDDDYMYGVHVAADLDTVVYTLAGIEGPHGWGIAGDSFRVMDELDARGVDTSFRLGDRDLATCLRRTASLRAGTPLSSITADHSSSLGVTAQVVPATNEPVRTRVQIGGGEWLAFQEYFVRRGHRDRVVALRYEGTEASTPAPGVMGAIEAADLIVIAPSNPPLSIWPILEVPGIRSAVSGATNVVAISPLFGGKALKGPADRVLESLKMPPGTAGIQAAYEGLLSTLIVDLQDSDDVKLGSQTTSVVAADTRIADPAAGRSFAAWLLDTMVQ
jgi:LPPG:FO 2-phospho-L-lactate transferase